MIGVGVYQIYYLSFEKKGESPLRGLVFFFGLLFIIEVALLLKFGVDYRLVEAPYIGALLPHRRRSASRTGCWCRAWSGS